MKVQLLGTGSILSSSLGASALIDDKIMIDCPNGIIKKIHHYGCSVESIDLLLISHFHADHFFDLPFFLMENGWKNERQRPLTIIGPKGLETYIDQVTNLAYPKDWNKIKRRARVNLIEINTEFKPMSYEGYSINCLQVDHDNLSAYGFVIKKDSVSVGFTCDSILCDNVIHMVDNCAFVFADCSFAVPSRGAHMSLEDITLLKQRHQATVLPIHMSDEARSAYFKKYGDVPTDGIVFML